MRLAVRRLLSELQWSLSRQVATAYLVDERGRVLAVWEVE